MRLDKFFQIMGLIKRRVLAHEACKRSLAKVNGLVAKPTREVQMGDIIELDLPRRFVKVKLLQEITSGNLPKSKRDEYVEILEDVARTPSFDDSWEDE